MNNKNPEAYQPYQKAGKLEKNGRQAIHWKTKTVEKEEENSSMQWWMMSGAWATEMI